MSNWLNDAFKACAAQIRAELRRSMEAAEANHLDRALARTRGNTLNPTGQIRVTTAPLPLMTKADAVIETVLIADTLPIGREEAIARGLKLTTTKIVSHPDQVRGWSLDVNVAVIDTQQRMSPEKRQRIDYHLSLCTMASRNKGLAQWLRDRIEEDRAEWTPVLHGARLNGKATARAVLAQCDAHTAVLDLHFVRSDGSDLCNEDSDPYPCGTIKALGVAHRDHFGYRTEWRP